MEECIISQIEYDRNTLKDEYFRDLEKGDDVAIPKNYLKNNDLNEKPSQTWR